MEFVQELNENIECLESENEGLRINLTDLECDNKQLLSKNFRASIIQQNKEYFAPEKKASLSARDNSLNRYEEGSEFDLSYREVEVQSDHSKVSKHSKILLEIRNSDFAEKIKGISAYRSKEKEES